MGPESTMSVTAGRSRAPDSVLVPHAQPLRWRSHLRGCFTSGFTRHPRGGRFTSILKLSHHEERAPSSHGLMAGRHGGLLTFGGLECTPSAGGTRRSAGRPRVWK